MIIPSDLNVSRHSLSGHMIPDERQFEIIYYRPDKTDRDDS
jgi:hypothetical protein